MTKTKNELVEIEEVKDLPKEIKADLQKSFSPLFESAKKWEVAAKEIIVTDIKDVEGMKKARKLRLQLKDIRTETENIRKKLKKESLLKGRAIDGLANLVKFIIVPLEDHLEEQEKFAQIQEKKRLDELEEGRVKKLSEYVEDVSIYDLRNMSEEAYTDLLESQKRWFEIKEKQEAEKEEKIRRLNIIIEIEEKVKSWGLGEIESLFANKESLLSSSEAAFTRSIADINSKVAASIEAVKKENEKLKLEREEKEKKDAAERKKAAEKEQKRREAEQKKLEAERKKREALELKIKQQKEEEAKEAKKKATAEKEARLAPDKDKLKRLAADLLDVSYPEAKSDEAKKIVSGVKDLMKKVNIYIVENIEKL